MKRLLLLTTAVIALFVLGSAAWYYSQMKPVRNTMNLDTNTTMYKKLLLKLASRATQAKEYTTRHKYNTDICFLIDLSIESGRNRFFVYNLQKDSITGAGLVTHGRCNETWLKGRRYGNEVGCGCTSLGRYKIGAAYKGKFGLAYKLHGQDATNSNAFKRYVVLHAHECVPYQEVNPYPICQSDGCPTVSPTFLKKLAATIDGSPRPILLWIFE